MNIYAQINASIIGLVRQEFADVIVDKIDAVPPKDPAHGDIATNAAMVIAAQIGRNPKEIAAQLLVLIQGLASVEKAEIAGPGFINITLAASLWQQQISVILEHSRDYGTSTLGAGKKVNIEYVSANPTGPMHAGHVRGAVIGDALANLMTKAGYDVTREYYFNDAGVQVDVLARTAYLRYREALGEALTAIPEGLYPGEYLKEVGAALAARDREKWLDKPESEWLVPIRDFAVSRMMDMIRADLDLIGIHHDVFSNEREIIENGTLDTAFQILEAKGLIYTGTLPPPRGKAMEDWEPVPLTLFRSTLFGDSTDRPLKKRDGTWAYFMPDIAYHYDKVRRGFELMINMLGTDHGGYQERMQPVVAAFSDGKATIKVIYNNIVKVFKNGEPVKLSKRSGNLITLREMVEQVGAGAVRFFMLTRDPKSSLDFDFVKVVEQSKDNPVFYVQYAHARCRSILRNGYADFPEAATLAETPNANITAQYTHPAELALIRLLASWPRIIEQAANALEPHRIPYFLHEVASSFHGFWNLGNDDLTLRFLQKDAIEKTASRIALARAVSEIIASGLMVMGVEPMEEMR